MWESGDKARTPGFYFWPRLCLLPDLGPALARASVSLWKTGTKAFTPLALEVQEGLNRAYGGPPYVSSLLLPLLGLQGDDKNNTQNGCLGSRVPGVWRPSHPSFPWGEGDALLPLPAPWAGKGVEGEIRSHQDLLINLL